jgi:hypothetical protein
MTIGSCLRRLGSAASESVETFRELLLTLGDVPHDEDEPACVEALVARVTDVEGRLQSMTDSIAAALREDAEQLDTRRCARAVAVCQEICNDVSRMMHGELATARNFIEINTVADERGGAWTRWREVVQHELEQCQSTIDAIAAALLECWREIADRGGGAVSVTATNIGQQVTV